MPDGERVTTGSEPRREAWQRRVSAVVDQAHEEDWGGKHRTGFCEACADAYLVAQYAVPGGPAEVVEPGHDEQTEELRAVLRRNGRPDTAPELQADFERRREQAIRDWAPYVGHHKDGEPIYHADTVAAVVERLRSDEAKEIVRYHIDKTCTGGTDEDLVAAHYAVDELAARIEERFKPSAPGGGNGH